MKSLFLLPWILVIAACASASDEPAGGGGGGAVREGSVKAAMRGGGAGSRGGETFSRDEEPAPVARERASGAAGIRVTWEALAVELDKMKNPRFKQQQQIGFAGVPEYRVVLLNESHPDAAGARKRTREAEVAVLSDEDMQALIDGFETASFFKFARPTGGVERLFTSERSRGRITVERGDESVTLLSQQGLGLDASTKAIPGIYAQAKAAVSIMKNRTSGLSVKTFGTEALNAPSSKGR